MTTSEIPPANATTPAPMTVRWVLAGNDDAAPVVTERAATDLAARVEGMSDRVEGVVGREVAGAVAGLADLDIVDILAAGWRKDEALATAAQATIDHPDSEELVDLATHRIESTHRPGIDLTLDGAVVATIDVEISVDVMLRAVVATVRSGRLVGIDGGRCVATATMTAEGFELASGSRTFETPVLSIWLGRGLPLLAQVPPEPTPARHAPVASALTVNDRTITVEETEAGARDATVRLGRDPTGARGTRRDRQDDRA